jgi:RNase P/RNase MRP subunit p30
MFADIVFPDGKEKDFIKMAERLSIPALALTYEHGNKKDYRPLREKIAALQKKTQVSLFLALQAKQSDIGRARRFCDLLIVRSTPTDRAVIERKEVDCLFGLEGSHRKDPMHFRASGMNQVIGKIMSDNGIILCMPFSWVLDEDGERRATIIGRIMQNMRIAKQFKVKAAWASFATHPYDMRSMHDMASIGVTFGMDAAQAKDAINELNIRLLENKARREKQIVEDGIKII